MMEAWIYIQCCGEEFYELTGQFPPLKALGEIKPMPYYPFKINVLELEKILGIKREPDFWELVKEYIKNEMEDEMIYDIIRGNLSDKGGN